LGAEADRSEESKLAEREQGPLITILTPTYNRAEYLPKLYQSLLAQDSDRWSWLIVDDGSTDHTPDLVQKWKEENPQKVRYLKKTNGGKHTALNLGIANISTPLTFIVDSDDTLLPCAVRTVEQYYWEYEPRRTKENLCGFSFLRINDRGEVNAGEYAEDNTISTYAELRINAGDTGDKAEVFYTSVLKKFLFPVFYQERFLPEDAVWMAMSGEYRLVFANRKIYVCDYHDGGLTKTGRYMKVYSPLGMMYRSAVYLNSPQLKNTKVKLKMLALYQIYMRFAKRRYGLKNKGNFEQAGIPSLHPSILWNILYIPTYFVFLKWSGRYENERK
jgi:glycosyltransferase involved in cell wall biosynthesis